MSYQRDVASTAMAAVFAACAAACGPGAAVAHDVSAASRLSELEGDLPPCSLNIDTRIDCHIHDPQTFREMRRHPPDENRPHAHEEYEQEEDDCQRDRDGRC